MAERSEPAPPGASPLLIEVMHHGRRVCASEAITVTAERLAEDLGRLPASALLLHGPTVPEVRVSQQLERLTRRVADARSGKLQPYL